MISKVVVRYTFATLRATALAGLFAACGGGSDPLAPVAVTHDVTLAVGAWEVVAGAAVSGALAFPAAGAQGAQYLVVGQVATTTADFTSPFVVRGQQDVAAAVVGGNLRAASPALRFHHALRRREAAMASQAFAYRAPFEQRQLRTPPPLVGDQRSFRVCSNLDCNVLKNVPSTARFVGTHAAIFVDDSVPANGFTAADLAQLGGQFDSVLHPINVSRFGAESDIDGNGVVIVLLSKQINALVGEPQCETSFITGYFFGADISPGFAASYNNGEVFYGLVPDPIGQVTCNYSVPFVKRILQVTFIHEFQHMISFNQHVLVRNGPSETLWLNEALSHLAEELGGLHYDSAGVDTTASRFFIGNFFNAYAWLADPEAAPLITEEPPGSLESRGAGWLFVRWLVDQFGANTARSLVQTTQIGGAAVRAAAATPRSKRCSPAGSCRCGSRTSSQSCRPSPPPPRCDTPPGISGPPSAICTSRSGSFPLVFPLVPHPGAGATTAVAGTISAGAGAYVLVTQPTGGAAFDLYFRRG